MGNFIWHDWQTAVSILIVFTAALFLARTLWPGESGSGCGKCSRCDNKGQDQRLVQLQSDGATKKRQL